MTTEHIFSIVFLLYMMVNVVYDLKYHITKNFLHYPMAILLLAIAFGTGQFISTLLIGIYTLTFFILFSKLPILSFGAGDVKMLVNVFMFLNIVSYWDTMFLFLTAVVVYIFVSLIGEIGIRTVKRNWKGTQVHAEAPFIFTALLILQSLI